MKQNLYIPIYLFLFLFCLSFTYKPEYHAIQVENNHITDPQDGYNSLEEGNLELYLKHLLINNNKKNDIIIPNDTTILIIEKYFSSLSEYNKAVMHKQYLTIAGIIILITNILITSSLKRKNNRIKNQLLEKELTISNFEGLSSNYSDYNEKSRKLRELLSQQLQISKKIAIMNSTSNDKDERVLKTLNEIIYGDPQNPFDWEDFYRRVNELNNNILIKLQEGFPSLSPNEIQFCSLVQARFETGEIAFILKISPNTVRMKKVMIRKKLGITDGGDLNLFFDQFSQNN